MRQMLKEIARQLEASNSANASPIPRANVERWMKSSSINEMGATYALLMEPGAVKRIEPSIPSASVVTFLRRYFERCLKEDPKSDWANSRYSAGWDLARLLLLQARTKTKSRQELAGWISWVANLYKGSDEPVRQAIETSILEHVLAEPFFVKHFGEWRNDPKLRSALERSLNAAHPFPDMSNAQQGRRGD